MKRITKHREDLLLDLLGDIASGEVKGDRLLAFDSSTLAGRAIVVEGDEGKETYNNASLGDLERLADEGYLETDWQGKTLYFVALPTAWKYRDDLRAIGFAKGQSGESTRK